MIKLVLMCADLHDGRVEPALRHQHARVEMVGAYDRIVQVWPYVTGTVTRCPCGTASLVETRSLLEGTEWRHLGGEEWAGLKAEVVMEEVENSNAGRS